MDRAAQAAQKAFPTGATCPATRRRDLLHAIADGIERRADDIAVLESWDSGQPIRFMSKAALRGAENFRFYADRAESARDGLALPTDTHLNYTARTPIGPVGVITPWNTPFMLSTWKIAPALAAGCTVVHKPAEWSPVTAQLLAEIALEAGLPPGVLNVVHGFGEEAGRALTEHESIRAIAFVGESATGVGDHAPGIGDPEARALRARRQEPGDRLRGRGSRARARCGDVHDLQPERRAVHVVEPLARPGLDRRGVHRAS